MNEGDLKDGLVKRLRILIPNGVTLRHEDQNTAGIPDISFTWQGFTTWLEVKYAKPHIRERGVQRVTCTRLANQGRCWYVIYVENKIGRSTIIQRPRTDFRDLELEPGECATNGFSHDFVVEFLRSSHDG